MEEWNLAIVQTAADCFLIVHEGIILLFYSLHIFSAHSYVCMYVCQLFLLLGLSLIFSTQCPSRHACVLSKIGHCLCPCVKHSFVD